MSITEPTDLSRFWPALAVYLQHACALFGLPAKLAQKLWLPRAEHKRIAGFLRPLEAILRALIFIDALALPPQLPQPAQPPPPERKRRAGRVMPTAFGAALDLDNSETWRATFRIAPNIHRGHAAAARALVSAHAGEGAGASHDRVSASPSALRLEALIRGYNKREQLAQRLACKLQADASAALGLIAPISKKNAGKPGYITLADLIPYANPAFERRLAPALNSS